MSVNLGPYTFQLTASQGGWHMDSVPPAWRNVFQLTASQGGWRRFRFWNDWQWNFNSQPHKEADTCDIITLQIIRISTHSLTRRLTQLTAILAEYQQNFNSQPHKEADLFAHYQQSRLYRFQLTASQGGWQQFQTKTYLSKTDFSTYYTY